MAAAVASIKPPPTSGGTLYQQPPWKSNAVDRSNEFLSASRTALKIAQQQHRQRQEQDQQPHNNQRPDKNDNALPDWMSDLNPSDLKLHQYYPPQSSSSSADDDTAVALIQDSQTLLQLLDSHLSDLHSLVRRRGHTNDPTLEIQSVMERFQESAKEVKEVCDSLRMAGTKPCTNIFGESKRSSVQRRKHYELLSMQLEGMAKERTDKLKKDLETRSKVLADQSRRRKMLASGGGGTGVGGSAGAGQSALNANPTTRPPVQPTRLPRQNKAAVNASSQFQSPLFTATSGGGGGGIGAAKKNGSSAYPGYAGYGGSASTNNGQATYAGYGGTSSAPPSFATGMRQRKQQQQPPSQPQQPKSHIQIDNGNEDNDYENKYNKSQNGEESTSIQQQISLRRQNRATKTCSQQARLAEKSIAELGVMFTKMSSLVSQQGEMLERIEDDVEAAGGDIDAGHDELVKVYGMTKGNRGLILKVFGILIFLIVFMKLY